MTRLRFVVVTCAAIGVGCTEDKPCGGFGGFSTINGQRTDLVTKPGDYSGYGVTGPNPCGTRSEMISVTGTGTRRLGFPPDTGCDFLPDSGGGGSGQTGCPVVNAWSVLGEIKYSLREVSITAYDPWECTIRGHGILIDDWSRGDEAIQRVAQTVTDWDLDDSVEIVIGPVLLECF